MLVSTSATCVILAIWHACLVQYAASAYQVPDLVEVYAEVYSKTQKDAPVKMYKVQEYVDQRAMKSSENPSSSATLSYMSIRVKNEKSGNSSTYYVSERKSLYPLIIKFDEEQLACSLDDIEFWDLKDISTMAYLLSDAYGNGISGQSTVVSTVRLLTLATKIGHKLKLKYAALDRRRKVYIEYYLAKFDLPEEFITGGQLNNNQVVYFIVGTAQPKKDWKTIASSWRLINDAPLRIQMLILNKDVEFKSSNDFVEKCDSALGVTVDYYVVQPIQDINGLISPTLGINNPLTLPVGIGCSKSRNYEATILSDVTQFSGQFIADNMMSAFVAYDQDTSILRMDRLNTKIVIDFANRALYNIDLSASSSSSSSSPSSSSSSFEPEAGRINQSGQDDAGGGGKLLLTEAHEIRLCSVSPLGFNFIKRLAASTGEIDVILGFGPQRPVFKMGSTQYDGMECEVYEVEWTKSMQPLIFGHGILATHDTNYYILVYITTERGEATNNKFGTNYNYRGLIKRLELRSHKRATNQMSLVKSITFSSFQWSLEVSPFRSESLSNERPVQIFDTPECMPYRNSQMLIKFSLDFNATVSPKDLGAVKSHKTVIEESVMKKMAFKMRLPRSRITELESKFFDDSMVISAKLLEAPRYMFFDKQVGAFDLSSVDESKLPPAEYIMAYVNSYECLTAAARHGQVKTMKFCPANGLCYLYSHDYKSLFGDKLKALTMSSQNQANFTEDLWYTCIVSEIGKTQAQASSSVGCSLSGARTLSQSIESFAFKLNVAPGSQLKDYTWNVKNLITRRLDDNSNNNFYEAQAVLKGLYYDAIPSGLTDHDDYVVKVIVLELSKRRGRLFCQKACSLERSCRSYSLCVRENTNICALSTLTLDKTNIDELFAAKAQFIGDSTDKIGYVDQRDAIQFNYIIGRDDRCTLHKLDMINQYDSFNNRLVVVDVSKQAYTVKPLHECLLSSRKNLISMGTIGAVSDSSFKYCPARSLCIHANQADALVLPHNNDTTNDADDATDADDDVTPSSLQADQPPAPDTEPGATGSSNKDDSDVRVMGETLERIEKIQSCLKYQFDMSSFYQKEPDKRLRLVVDGKETNNEEITRELKGLTEEQCSIECLYGDSACVSYDYCRMMKSSMPSCFLNHVRTFDMDDLDNETESGDFVALSPIEQQIYKTAQKDTQKKRNVALVTDKLNYCDHNHLTKQNIAVKYLIGKYKLLKLGHIAKDEKAIDESLGQQSSQKIDKLKEYLSQMIDGGKQTSGGASNKQQFLLVIVGMIIGAILILYSKDISSKTTELYDNIRARKHQTGGRQMSISNVTLTDNYL